MIGHGTTGSDGMEAGIHLRWAFQDKLGFPSCFKLYRRASDTNNRYQFQLDKLTPRNLQLPFTSQVNQNTSFSFRLASAIIHGQEANTIQVESIALPGGVSIISIHLSGELYIRFSAPVNRIELQFFLTQHTRFQLIAQSVEGDFYPHTVWDSSTGLKNIAFDAPEATGLVLKGEEIHLVMLAVWICVPGDGWRRINTLCGCGLPVNQKRTEYINEMYSHLIGTDLAIALCRLGYRTVEDSPITAVDFIALKAMLLTMQLEGSLVPVGWTLFPSEGTEETVDLAFSKYDSLLMRSLDVIFAKILGLYFLETEVGNDSYYDYKVTAEWPEWNKRRLDYELTFEAYAVNFAFFSISPLDDEVVFVGTDGPVVVVNPFSDFRTDVGLSISSPFGYSALQFVEPVTEVQLFLFMPDFATGVSSITVEAYQNFYSTPVDKQELTLESGVLRLRAERIDSIRLYGSTVILCRLHYDFEPYPVGLQYYICCGLKQSNQLPLSLPTRLKASLLPGGTVTDQDGNILEKPYLAGLRWEVNEEPDAELISIAPVLYHLQRQVNGGAVEVLTADSPLFVSPSVLQSSQRDIPLGWPSERQYYTEAIAREDQCQYQVAGQDLFGRRSEFTSFETYVPTYPRPPHPEKVRAQYLDYSTYNPHSDTFSDKTLIKADKDWLRSNGRSAIVVRWEWPENLQLQAPDVEGFRSHFKAGWLNTYAGILTSGVQEAVITKTSLNLTTEELEKYAILQNSLEDIETYWFQTTLNQAEGAPENAFRLCWLTQGSYTFLVLQNTSGNQPNIWVLKLNGAVSFAPQPGKGFGIAVTAEKAHFIDYKNPETWLDTSIFQQQAKDLTPKQNPDSTAYPIYREDYTVYIEDPAFPNPAIQATDATKVRYGQIGVNSYVGNREGSVSTASTIMAIYRDAPPAPAAFAPVAGQAILALKASPANVHGKSSFALRWNKTRTGVKHYVYRALDETLFLVDNKARLTRPSSVYNDLRSAYAGFDPADVAVVEQIPHEPKPKLVAAHYTSLTPAQLQILASLSDNAGAFTQINERPIDENDLVYADRITEIPDPVNGANYVADPVNVLLYLDNTLNGQSNNRTFYALRSVDSNGLTSALSLATPPVEIPQTTPPPAPVITAILGGENKLIIQWAKSPGASIAGYLLYRTQDAQKANDWRRMELVKANDTDVFTYPVDSHLPKRQFRFVDTSVIARQAYWYAVVAVGLSDEGKWLKSRPSTSKTGQAYDLTPPEPPEWDVANSGWVYVDDSGIVYEWTADLAGASNPRPAIRLVWFARVRVDYLLIGRSVEGSSLSNVMADWVPGVLFDGEAERYFLDTSVSEGQTYTYSAKSKSMSGLTSTAESSLVISPA